MNPETVQFLQQAAEKGAWEFCSFELHVDSRRPEAGSEVTVVWEIKHINPADGQAGGGVLNISSADRNENLAVPEAGRIGLNVGVNPICVELRVRGERKRVTVKPRVVIPEIVIHPPDKVVLEEASTISWAARNAVSCHIQVLNGDEVVCAEEVPANGQMNFIARKLQPVTIHLQAKSRHAHISDSAVKNQRITLEPEVAIPEIKIDPVQRLVVGEPGQIGWQIQRAERCSLEIRNGGEILYQGDIPAKGQVSVTPRVLSAVEMRIFASSRHAHLSERANAVLASSLDVFAPPVHILVDGGNTQSGFLGDEVTFNWKISGAQAAYLKASDRDKTFPVPVNGGIAAEIGMEEEVFSLIAVGLDGTKHKKILKVVPQFADLSAMPGEFNLLHSTFWEG